MKSLSTFLFSLATLSAMAQSVAFDDYKKERGYYDAPWLRYEAEPDRCSTNGVTLGRPAEYSQTELQAEASNNIATSLLGKGDYVAWTADAAGAGLTIRFSLPDNAEGTGITGNIALYIGEEKVADIELNSYWAWQYTKLAGNEKYPDNTPSSWKFARMRFDEKYVLLTRAIEKGEMFSLRKEDDNDTPYTIDFVEVEPVAPALTFADIEGDNKVEYNGDGTTLQSFINQNGGKTIFLPAGYYTVPRRLMINADNTRLIGAGMWHTTLYFSASSDLRSTYSQRGIETNSNSVHVEGLTLNTVNNKRYFENNSAYQVGKGFMGSWGSNSVIRDVRVDHFECGAWIADYAGSATDNLTISHCRFRNNYADGVNFCTGVANSSVTHCSFRNNGDDDMASWSATHMAHDNEFSHCTAEHNWRASSVALYGGDNNRAHHILVLDAMECGVHANGEFQGTGFGSRPSIISDITIRNAGCVRGTCGVQGDFWGNAQGALHIMGGSQYDVKGLQVTDIDIFGARGDGVVLACTAGKSLVDLVLRDITVHSAGGYGYNYYRSVKGNGIYSNLTAGDCAAEATDIPSSFNFINDPSAIHATEADAPEIEVNGTEVSVHGTSGAEVAVHNLRGSLIKSTPEPNFRLAPGFYIISVPGKTPVKIVCG